MNLFTLNVYDLVLQIKIMHTRTLINRYNKGSSIQDIAAKSGCSTRKVRDVLVKNGIERRTHSEANYIKANPAGDPFRIRRKLTPEEDHLKAMALGLYLTEGNIKHKHSIKFSNSNPGIVKIFVKFLKIACGVPADKIKASLIVYPDINIRNSKDYWSKFLDLPLKQFSKTTVLKSRNNNSSKRHSDVGTATIYVHNSKLLNIIKDWAKEYSYVAQLVER